MHEIHTVTNSAPVQITPPFGEEMDIINYRGDAVSAATAPDDSGEPPVPICPGGALSTDKPVWLRSDSESKTIVEVRGA